jgi:hypothetical protein
MARRHGLHDDVRSAPHEHLKVDGSGDVMQSPPCKRLKVDGADANC